MKVGIAGAAGKMGRALVRAVQDNPALILTAAWEIKGTPFLGQDAGQLAGGKTAGVLVSDDMDKTMQKCNVVIDFTSPEATLAIAKQAVAAQCALVIGTTGLKDDQLSVLRQAGEKIAIVYATNFSTGVNVLWALAQEAARILGDSFDAEIVEAHHNLKKDAPSGTAITLLESICQGKGWDPKQVVRHGREGLVGARTQQEIGMHAVRGGDIVGDHLVLFAGPGERIELRHQAHSRDTLARGAVRATAWLQGKAAGFYHMSDVLGIVKHQSV